MKKITYFAIALAALTSCNEAYTPKQRGYFRIDLPPKAYTAYQGDCPFDFDVPLYSKVEKDDAQNAEPCWLNVDFLPFGATLHLTYKQLGKDIDFGRLQDDSRKLVYEHTIKADEITEREISNEKDHVYGMVYDLKGNTATSLQFFVTDSIHHYVRGVLYFNSRTNADSIAPVQEYLSQDVMKVLATIRWKN